MLNTTKVAAIIEKKGTCCVQRVPYDIIKKNS